VEIESQFTRAGEGASMCFPCEVFFIAPSCAGRRAYQEVGREVDGHPKDSGGGLRGFRFVMCGE